MKTSIFASLALAVACSLGCDRKVETKPAPAQPINVQAPGVNVEVAPGKGVSVQAPGVDVETAPGGAKVDVVPETPK